MYALSLMLRRSVAPAQTPRGVEAGLRCASVEALADRRRLNDFRSL